MMQAGHAGIQKMRNAFLAVGAGYFNFFPTSCNNIARLSFYQSTLPIVPILLR